MNTIEIIITIIAAFAAGILLSWLLVKAQWAARLSILQAAYDEQQKKSAEQTLFLANSEKAMRDAFGSLAADALHKNNHAFVTLAESRLGEKVTEAKGILEGKETAIDKLVEPLKNSLDKMETKINDLEIKREGAYSNIQTNPGWHAKKRTGPR